MRLNEYTHSLDVTDVDGLVWTAHGIIDPVGVQYALYPGKEDGCTVILFYPGHVTVNTKKNIRRLMRQLHDVTGFTSVRI